MKSYEKFIFLVSMAKLVDANTFSIQRAPAEDEKIDRLLVNFFSES